MFKPLIAVSRPVRDRYHIYIKAPVSQVGLKHVMMGFDASLDVFDYLVFSMFCQLLLRGG